MLPRFSLASVGPPSGNRSRLALALSVCLLLLVSLAGCGPAWQAVVVAPDGSDFAVDAELLEGLADYAVGEQGLPLERVLWLAGHHVIERLQVTADDGSVQDYAWSSVAEDAWWHENGQISIGGQTFAVSRLAAEPPALPSDRCRR